ncbi:MAG: polyprenyl synthetase family protein [Deltaproteobacteria bacterium]|nr:polyprenyl synthetase family protein [Deltaproteobacteria bacterium]
MQETEFLQRVKDTAINLLRRKEVFEDIVQEFDGGKMVRPRTIYILSLSLNEFDFERLIPLATSTELVHLASLFHDDVIDNGMIRRNRQTLNARYGNLISILAGDYFYSVASRLVLENYNSEVAKIYSYAVSYMTLMELRQASLRWSYEISKDDYFDIIRGKTGALFSASFEALAIIFNKSELERLYLREAGMLFGEIFQLTDDLLDFVGRRTGKSKLKDLSEGDITLPALLLMEKNGRFKELVIEYFRSKGEKQHLIKEIERVLNEGSSPEMEINEIIEKDKEEIKGRLRRLKGFSMDSFSPFLNFISVREM